MAPTIVFRDGKPRLALGTPGSVRIFPAMAQVIGNVTRGPFQLTYNGTLTISDNPASLQSIWAGAMERALLGSAAEK